MKRITMLLGAGFLMLSSMVYAAVPQLINFQGILKDGSGNPVADGSYFATFRIYSVPASGSVLWADTQTVSTSDGLFNAFLGRGTPVPDSVFNDTSRYLGITVFPDPEMTPRQRLTASGYSFRSGEWGLSGNNIYRLSGNVGIGTSSPTKKLEVAGSIKGDTVFSNVLSSNSPLSLQAPAGTTRMFLDDVGRIGIGTTSPATQFHISLGSGEGLPLFGGAEQAVISKNPTATDGCFLNIIAGSLGPAGVNFGDNSGAAFGSILYSNGSDQMIFYTLASQRMVITSVGNVGIGTTNPSAKLDVAGSVEIGGGTPIVQVLSASAALDFPNTASQAASDLAVTVIGAALGDVVALGVPNGSTTVGSNYTGWVSAANTVTVRFSNFSGIAQNPASGTFRAMVTKF